MYVRVCVYVRMCVYVRVCIRYVHTAKTTTYLPYRLQRIHQGIPVNIVVKRASVLIKHEPTTTIQLNIPWHIYYNCNNIFYKLNQIPTYYLHELLY